jgi:hypothetical protein
LTLNAPLSRFVQRENGGLVLLPDSSIARHRDLVIALAARHRLPAVYSDRVFVLAGGLMSYGSDRDDDFLKTAKALGLTVPPGLLVAADEVID